MFVDVDAAGADQARICNDSERAWWSLSSNEIITAMNPWGSLERAVTGVRLLEGRRVSDDRYEFDAEYEMLCITKRDPIKPEELRRMAESISRRGLWEQLDASARHRGLTRAHLRHDPWSSSVGSGHLCARQMGGRGQNRQIIDQGRVNATDLKQTRSFLIECLEQHGYFPELTPLRFQHARDGGQRHCR
ncbi:MAG: hypothetical protein IPH99_01795 [Xanthomonadales bacterium]|nr:hypothetical protein [Xanthomonadales bacterium]